MVSSCGSAGQPARPLTSLLEILTHLSQARCITSTGSTSQNALTSSSSSRSPLSMRPCITSSYLDNSTEQKCISNLENKAGFAPGRVAQPPTPSAIPKESERRK